MTTTMTEAVEVERRAGPREWLGLAVLALGALVASIDTSVVLLALPHIAAELHANSSEQLWIVDAYGFVLAGFLVTFGGLADRLGRRRMAMLGAAVLGVASMAAAFAPVPEVLIGARAAGGLGAAALTPALYGLLTGMFRDERQRALALGVFMTCFMGGMILGPLIGGAALAYFWWGSVFLLAVPVMTLLLALCPVLVTEPERAGDGERRRIDRVSVPLSLLAVLPVVYGLKELARTGFHAASAGTILLGAAFAVAFVRRQRTVAAAGRREPLLDLTMFRNRGFGLVLTSLLMMTMLTGPLMMLNTQYFQLVAGAGTFTAGVWTVPSATVSAAGFVLMPLLARRIRPGVVIAAGLALMVAGLLVMARVSPYTGPWPLVVGFSLVSLGAAPLPTLGTNLIIGSVPLAKASSAASTSETSGQLGYALGIAVVGSLVTLVYRLRLPGAPALGTGPMRADAAAAFCSGVRVAALVAAAAMAVLAVVTAVRLRHVESFGK